MTARTAILWLVALFTTAFCRAGVSNDFVQTSDLRSAYLERAGLVAYDKSNVSPAGLRQQVQRHFDVVLKLLDVATPQSIEIAIARLEAAENYSWTSDERIAHRRELTVARRLQLQRISAYRDRGIFPLNEGQSSQPAPVFVDRHGTDCAVGHLMRQSGWGDEVDAISRTNNLVYVREATQSAIAVWVLTSGLTLEEAALIQPGYPWRNADFDASAYEPGELVLERNGLRYSNFRLQAQNYFGGGDLPTNTGTKPTLAGLGLSAGAGTYSSPVPGSFTLMHVPIGTHFLAVGPSNPLTGLHHLQASAPSNRSQLTLIKFDVAPIMPDQRINGISQTSYEYLGGFQNLIGNTADTEYYLDTTVRDGGTSLASLHIDKLTPGSGFTRKSDTESFAPRQQISVESEIWLWSFGFQTEVRIDTFMLDFNVVTVPEPASGIFAGALIACCIRRVRT